MHKAQLGLLALATVVSLGLAGCASSGSVPVAPNEADKVLLDRGNEALAAKKWITARQYFSKLLEGYPQSQYRADAKLGVGDSYLGENNSASFVYAVNEYREFLAFYPTNLRADYAQYQLGMVHLKQMLGPQRDQTETKAALEQFEAFRQRYPNSALLPEVIEKERIARVRWVIGGEVGWSVVELLERIPSGDGRPNDETRPRSVESGKLR